MDHSNNAKTIGLIVGSLLIIAGFVVMWIPLDKSAEFGADFYTYVYGSIRRIEIAMGIIIIAIGAAIDVNALKD